MEKEEPGSNGDFFDYHKKFSCYLLSDLIGEVHDSVSLCIMFPHFLIRKDDS